MATKDGFTLVKNETTGNWELTCKDSSFNNQEKKIKLNCNHKNMDGDLIVDVKAKSGIYRQPTGQDNYNYLSISPNGYVTSNSLSLTMDIGGGWIDYATRALTVSNFQVGCITVGSISVSNSSSGTLYTYITPTTISKYVICNNGYHSTKKYVKILPVCGYYTSVRTSGASYTLQKNEMAVVLTDNTTLNWYDDGGSAQHKDVDGGALVYWDQKTGVSGYWCVLLHNDTVYSLGSNDTKTVWVSSAKAMRKVNTNIETI